jgi:hypothetical protein
MKRVMEIGKTGMMGITVIFALVIVLLVTGCFTTTGTERSTAARVTMVDVEEDIRLLLLELSATNSALASLVNPLQNDLATSYEVFVDGNDELEKASTRFIDRSNKMNAEGREYFNEWRKQGDNYTNPKIQELSEQRRSDLGVVYGQIADASVGIEGELKQYVTNVQEVETYFSTDLTTEGVAAISPFANQTILDGFRLSTKLRELLESVEMVRAELSPGETATVE